MAMRVVFKKEPNKPPVMRCIREDGSETWMCSKNQGSYFAVHDMLHYAVETVMGYRSAFFGMVSGGRDLDDFEGDVEYTAEAFMAEEMVGVLQGLRQDGPITFELFQEAAELRWTASQATKPSVTAEQLDRIVSLWDGLTAQWRQMIEGEIVLDFPA